MTEQIKKILAEALELSPGERADLVEKLLTSFDLPDRQTIDALWAKEAENRIDAYERGELYAVSADLVFERLESPEKK